MTIVSGIVLYAIIWFMTLFVILPFRLKSQADEGDTTPGTHASAPADPAIGRRFLITSAIAALVWAGVVAIILSGAITIEDIDLFTRFGLGSDPR